MKCGNTTGFVFQVWSWVQQGSSVLSSSCEAGLQLCEAEASLNMHLQLRTQAEVHMCFIFPENTFYL